MFLLTQTFDSANELIEVLVALLERHMTVSGEREHHAQKLDTISDWKSWGWGSVGRKVTGITGPSAPHSFQFVRRADLHETITFADLNSDNLNHISELGGVKDSEDVMCIVKNYMRDKVLSEIKCVLSAGCTSGLPDMPPNTTGRKPIPRGLQVKVCNASNKLYKSNYLSYNAHAYLTNWVTQNLPRMDRPDAYPWLSHKWTHASVAPRDPMPYDPIDEVNPVGIAPVRPAEILTPVICDEGLGEDSGDEQGILHVE